MYRPLERAFDNYEITKILLEHDARLDFDSSEWGLRPGGPLWPAVRASKHLVVSALLDAGARLQDTDDSGRTPLHVACSMEATNDGNLEVVKTLLAHGANPLTKIAIKNSDSEPTSNKQTALEIAMTNKKLDIVGAMLNNLFPPDLGEDWYLVFAVKEKRSNPELVSTILEYGSNGRGKVDVNWKDGFGRTALFYAACSGYKEAVTILLASGADISFQDCDGRYVRDVVSTTTVRDLIWDHETESTPQGDEKEIPDTSASMGDNDENKDSNPSSESDDKTLQKEPRKPGDESLDPSTCKQTNHDGTCNNSYNWDIYWCNVCYQDIAGFAYRELHPIPYHLNIHRSDIS